MKIIKTVKVIYPFYSIVDRGFSYTLFKFIFNEITNWRCSHYRKWDIFAAGHKWNTIILKFEKFLRGLSQHLPLPCRFPTIFKMQYKIKTIVVYSFKIQQHFTLCKCVIIIILCFTYLCLLFVNKLGIIYVRV